MTMHILVPGRWTVQYGHDWAERIENDIRTALPFIHITTHVEPLEDPASMNDQTLDISDHMSLVGQGNKPRSTKISGILYNSEGT